MTEPAIPIMAHCNRCGPHTRHDALALAHRHWDDHDSQVDGDDRYQLLECRGCGKICLRHESWNSYETDDEGHPESTVRYYPPAISRKAPDWASDPFSPFGSFSGNDTISKLLLEIYTALQNDLPALAAMGIRAVIEHVMVEKVGDTGTIGGNVKTFIEQGYIAPKSISLFKDFLSRLATPLCTERIFPGLMILPPCSTSPKALLRPFIFIQTRQKLIAFRPGKLETKFPTAP
jgi:hypothetical protein